jgi:hypothetical protein
MACGRPASCLLSLFSGETRESGAFTFFRQKNDFPRPKNELFLSPKLRTKRTSNDDFSHELASGELRTTKFSPELASGELRTTKFYHPTSNELRR